MFKVSEYFRQTMERRYVIILLLALVAFTGKAATPVSSYLVRGIVKDSISDEAVPYARITSSSKKGSTVAGSDGVFEITVRDTTSWLNVTAQAYEAKTIKISRGQVNMYAVYLSPQVQELQAVVVKKQRYSKRNNPAVDMMQRLRRQSQNRDPRRNDYYNYRQYQRISIALNNFTKDPSTSKLLKRFPVLWTCMDTSDISGRPIMQLSVKETASDVHYRRQPKATREIVTAYHSTGVDQIFDQESMQTFLEDVLRPVDVFSGEITLLQNRFVGPLTAVSADFYRFYLGDTITTSEGRKLVPLSFYPRNKASFGFIGSMEVDVTDPVLFVNHIDMRISSDINLNFIQNLRLEQSYARATDGSRLITNDNLTLEGTVLPGTPGLYINRTLAYAGHDFDIPEGSDTIFAERRERRVERQAESRDTIYWEGVRLVELPKSQRNVSSAMVKLHSYPLYRFVEKGVKALFSGYISTSTPSYFDIGPLNAMASYNDIEGFKLRAGGMTTANLSPHWFGRFYTAYGFGDHKWKYGVEAEYSFNDKRYHSREFPVHSLRLNLTYDTYHPGQSYMFTNPDNFILSLKRRDDYNVTYQRLATLTYTRERHNGLSVTASVNVERQWPGPHLPLTLGTGEALPNFDMSWIDLELRYAPGEKFYQTRTYRLPVNLDAPVVMLSQRIGSRHIAGSRWSVCRTQLSVQKRFWMSAWGYLDLIGKGGHVWSRNTPYFQLFIPNANLTYTIQPESYALINAMEFIADSYASIEATYWANGALLNYVPLLKKLRLREVFAVRTFWGKLGGSNNPSDNTSLLSFPSSDGVGRTDVSKTPYVEASVGIENIFKCLRVDYVWRLTHRYPGYPVDRSGVRLAVHVTF